MEGLGIRTLERVDRLLVVAHREHGARQRPVPVLLRPAADEELLRQRAGDAPLQVRGVLHLVEQQVVDAAVQLVQHPGRARIGQQHQGAGDQVVVVHQPARPLGVRIAAEHRTREAEQRHGQRHHADRPALVLHRRHPFRFRHQRRRDLRARLGQLAADEALGRARLAAPCQEQGAPLVPGRRPVRMRQRQPARDLLRLSLQRRRADLHRQAEQPTHPCLVRQPRGRQDAGGLVGVPDPGHAAKRRLDRVRVPLQQRHRRCQQRRLALQPRHQPHRLRRPHLPGQQRQGVPLGRRRPRRQHLLPGAVQGHAGIGLLHQPEMRADRRFHREASQQRLAEGVDGADAHAAGQVQHPGEQGARRLAQRRRPACPAVTAEPGQPAVERSVVQRHPAPELALQPDRHLRRRRLGKGQALDPRRVGAGHQPALGVVRHHTRQHQPKQPVDQQLGLAAAGGRRHERRHVRIRRQPLLPVGQRHRVRHPAHAPSSRAALHSATRASCA